MSVCSIPATDTAVRRAKEVGAEGGRAAQGIQLLNVQSPLSDFEKKFFASYNLHCLFPITKSIVEKTFYKNAN